jgi:hypothetical protein
MAIPSFFRQTKPRGFKYVPRFYDPQKEEWDQKRRARSPEQMALSRERGDESTEQRAQGTESEESRAVSDEKKPYRSKIMRGSMKNYFPRNRERIQKQSMIRFVVILIILAFVIYIYLRY